MDPVNKTAKNARLIATFLSGGGAVGELVVDGVIVATVQLSAQEEANACMAPLGGDGMAMRVLWKKALEELKKAEGA